MADPALNHRVLERALASEALRAVLAEGHGGPLVFLWVLGSGALWVVFQAPLLAVVLTVVLGAAGIATTRSLLHHAETRAKLLGRVVERALACAGLQRGPLRGHVERSRAVFLEISTRAHSSAGLEGVLDSACSLLRLQYAAARRAEDHQRIRTLVQPTKDCDATLRALAAEEASLVAEAGANLETLLVQLLQLSRAPGDLLGMQRAAEERAETLHYLQARVEVQQQTAELIHRSMRPRA